jgi:hypothetical protein
MIALELTDPDGEKVLFNWDNVVAIVEGRSGFERKSRVRVRDGSIYDVKETMDEIVKRLTVAAELPT